MAETKHTPGPWEWERSDQEDGHVIRMGKAISDRSRYPAEEIVRYEHGLYPDEENERCREQFQRAEANAALMASAPDLLVALLGLDDLYQRAWDLVDPDGAVMFMPETVARFESLHAAAQAAIARARGEEAP